MPKRGAYVGGNMRFLGNSEAVEGLKTSREWSLEAPTHHSRYRSTTVRGIDTSSHPSDPYLFAFDVAFASRNGSLKQVYSHFCRVVLALMGGTTNWVATVAVKQPTRKATVIVSARIRRFTISLLCRGLHAGLSILIVMPLLSIMANPIRS